MHLLLSRTAGHTLRRRSLRTLSLPVLRKQPPTAWTHPRPGTARPSLHSHAMPTPVARPPSRTVSRSLGHEAQNNWREGHPPFMWARPSLLCPPSRPAVVAVAGQSSVAAHCSLRASPKGRAVATRGWLQSLRTHPCLRWPMPPNLGLSTQFLHVPQSSRRQPSHWPHRRCAAASTRRAVGLLARRSGREASRRRSSGMASRRRRTATLGRSLRRTPRSTARPSASAAFDSAAERLGGAEEQRRGAGGERGGGEGGGAARRRARRRRRGGDGVGDRRVHRRRLAHRGRARGVCLDGRGQLRRHHVGRLDAGEGGGARGAAGGDGRRSGDVGLRHDLRLRGRRHCRRRRRDRRDGRRRVGVGGGHGGGRRGGDGGRGSCRWAQRSSLALLAEPPGWFCRACLRTASVLRTARALLHQRRRGPCT